MPDSVERGGVCSGLLAKVVSEGGFKDEWECPGAWAAALTGQRPSQWISEIMPGLVTPDYKD